MHGYADIDADPLVVRGRGFSPASAVRSGLPYIALIEHGVSTASQQHDAKIYSRR
jgi:hypothetical protein